MSKKNFIRVRNNPASEQFGAVIVGHNQSGSLYRNGTTAGCEGDAIYQLVGTLQPKPTETKTLPFAVGQTVKDGAGREVVIVSLSGLNAQPIVGQYVDSYRVDTFTAQGCYYRNDLPSDKDLIPLTETVPSDGRLYLLEAGDE